MFNKLRQDNPDKYPENTGKLWTDNELSLLMNELEQNDNIENIATSHKRTVGGISAKIDKIAYDMFLKQIPINEIVEKTKITEMQLNEVIEKFKEREKSKKSSTNGGTNILNEIAEIRMQLSMLNSSVKKILNILGGSD